MQISPIFDEKKSNSISCSICPVSEFSDDSETLSEPPEGGVGAWLQVLAAFFFNLCAWGLPASFGVFKKYYQTDLLSAKSPTDLSWIGTLQIVLLLMGGGVSGQLFDRGYIKQLFIAGSVLIVLGFAMLSFATEYYQVLLSHGICVGIGGGLLFTPSLSLVALSFKKKRAIAVAIIMLGTPVGGLIYPPIFEQLYPQLGFGWATRIIALVALCLLSAACFIVFPFLKNIQTSDLVRPLIDVSAFTDAPFMAWSLVMFLLQMSFWVTSFRIPQFARFKLDTSDEFSTYLLMMSNGPSVLGRIIFAFCAYRFGMMEILFFCVIASAAILFGQLGVTSTTGFDVWVLFWGFFSGSLPGLAPGATPSLSPSPELVGTRTGMAFSIAALGILMGNPLANSLNDFSTKTFWKSEVFVATALVVCAVLMVYPMFHLRRKGISP